MADGARQKASNHVKELSALPLAGQSVEHNGSVYTTIKEGLAHILVPATAATSLDTKKHQNKEIDPATRQSVFYNPIQQFNRDLSVLAIRIFSEDLTFARDQRYKRRGQSKRQKKDRQPKGPNSSHENGVPPSEAQEPTALKRKADEALSQPSANLPVAKRQKQDDQAPTEDNQQIATVDSDLAVGSAVDVGPPPKRFKFKILDALSATGLRALRYAHEIPAVTGVTANDLSVEAVQSMKINMEHNRLNEKIEAVQGNALVHMYSFAGHDATRGQSKYDVIDLDPYGTAVPFIDAALHALNDGGLLCVTCTDAGVWASCGYPEKTYALYGGTPFKGFHSHEGGLRLIINAVATAAARNGLAIEPLLSLSIDFYARVFIRVERSPADVKHLAGKTMLVYSCDSGCGAWTTQPLGRNDLFAAKDGSTAVKHGLAQGPKSDQHCAHCGFKTHVSGPMYGGPLHNPAFLERILELLPALDKTTYSTLDRIEGMLSTALEETELQEWFPDKKHADTPERPVPRMIPTAADRHPFFFIPSALAGVLHCSSPGDAPIRGALRHAGYKASRSHAKPGSIRTDAPWEFIWHMMREWVRQRAPIKESSIKPSAPGYALLHRPGSDDKIESEPPAPGQHDASGNGTETKRSASPAKGASVREVVFDERLGKDPNKRRLVRYQENPRENWGPMNRAKK